MLEGRLRRDFIIANYGSLHHVSTDVQPITFIFYTGNLPVYLFFLLLCITVVRNISFFNRIFLLNFARNLCSEFPFHVSQCVEFAVAALCYIAVVDKFSEIIPPFINGVRFFNGTVYHYGYIPGLITFHFELYLCFTL